MLYPDEEDEDASPRVCGKRAVAVFTKVNPKKGPREPKLFRYPRCRIHFTEKAIGQAGIEGYDIIRLDGD